VTPAKTVSPEEFAEALRGALKTSWDLRFGQFLLALAHKDNLDAFPWLRYVPDADLARKLQEWAGFREAPAANNRAVADRHLSLIPKGKPAVSHRRDIMVFLFLADAFCEALRAAKEENPGMRYGEILENALVPQVGDREGQFRYQFREESIRMLHRWTTHKAMFCG